ncbi:hypothetical protein [Salinimicrobium oceani]|uniref:Uncharacterized protein n=1 Tax=Salinimicrobium oceani TaxID=2722702 RepID=A0ABX1CVE8_9FLAO|nr:hypothetical protein [Salinimicrobium oceani]NJW52248.1 hypothetical protein [Salinimicrobium oceani]
MIQQSPFWKYYRDFNFFNLSFSILSWVFFGPVSGLLIFLSFGMGIGYLGFNYFRKQEYHLYYNLGYRKSFLIKKVWAHNLVFMGPVLLILLLL